jgi:serine/threonine protein kinase
MSPEIARALLNPGQHLAYGKSTDVWSLGCVFVTSHPTLVMHGVLMLRIMQYEMLTTRHPFSGRTTVSLYKEILTKQTARITGIGTMTQALLDGLLRKDPACRLQLPAIISQCKLYIEQGKHAR